MQCGEDGVERRKSEPSVQNDIRAFGITRDWKMTALEAEVWVQTVMESGRRIKAVRRK